MTTPLPRALPGDVGIPPSAVTAFLEAVRADRQELHSLMIVRHGCVAVEAWWKPYAATMPHEVRSISKSFTATAVGFALQEGRLSLDDPVLSFFPAEAPPHPPENLTAVRVRHLLTMTSGHARNSLDPDAQREGRSWIGTVLAAPVPEPPGTRFVYDNGASYLLSAIVQRLTGQRLVDYLGPRIFEPLGIRGVAWETCPMGIDRGFSGLSLVTEDLARFGLLYLARGVGNGVRLLSESWVDEASRRQVSTGDGGASDTAHGYGYSFWRCRPGGYRAAGLFGQLCVVLPEHDAVLVTTAAADRAERILEAAWSTLLPAFDRPLGRALKRDQGILGRSLRTCRIPAPYFRDDPVGARDVDGVRFAMETNPMGVRSVGFAFARGRLVVAIGGRRSTTFRFGAGAWASGTARREDARGRAGIPVRCAYTWTGDGGIEAVIRWVTTPFVETLRFSFSGDGLTMTREDIRRAGHAVPAGAAPIRGRRLPDEPPRDRDS
jgi:CubicO group peptidase (beta-lactamase class C family)